MAIQNGASPEPQTIFVIGLGMVGIGAEAILPRRTLLMTANSPAFIEKMLGLDADRRYNIVTVGEEAHLAYNRVQLTDYMVSPTVSFVDVHSY